MLGMEVPGSNSGKAFLLPFLPQDDHSIRVPQSSDFTLAWFSLYKFAAVTQLLFKLSKGTATMISLSTHQFSSYFYTRFTL